MADPKVEEKKAPDVDEKRILLFNANDGVYGRPDNKDLRDLGVSQFGDRQEMLSAEALRAKVEGREPDYKNPGTTAGINLVPGSRLGDTRISVPSVHRTDAAEEFTTKALTEAKDDEDTFANPIAEAPLLVQDAAVGVPAEAAPLENENKGTQEERDAATKRNQERDAAYGQGNASASPTGGSGAQAKTTDTSTAKK